MTWTTPKTWSGSEVLTAADMNAQVSGNVDHLYDNCPETAGFTLTGTFVDQLNQRVESGEVLKACAKVTYGSTQVAFNSAFGTAPRVICTETGTDLVNATAQATLISGTGFRAYVWNGSGGTMAGSSCIHWQAIGA